MNSRTAATVIGPRLSRVSAIQRAAVPSIATSARSLTLSDSTVHSKISPTDTNDMTRLVVCGSVLLLCLCVPVAARECILATLTQAAKPYPFVLLGRVATSTDHVLVDRGGFSVIEVDV